VTSPEPLYVLYRMHDAARQLLYVGRSIDPGGRFRRHRGSQPWWPDVRTITLEHFASLNDLKQAERVAIEQEEPLHNVVHVPGRNTGKIKLPPGYCYDEAGRVQQLEKLK
jgi:hypothetical protein